ncbi:MAG TPA: MATE family efflux transporter [Candidatus Ruminococcus avistercoris]|nr:MATE family efflux transporter [Candidatus Ruminococcus avistercoris]
MDQTYMKKQPVLPLLMKMGIPMVISMLVNSLYNIVDSIFVAWISEDAMTALSLVYPIQNLVNAICIGFSVGVNAVIARKLGEGEKEKADLAATQGTLLSFLHGLLLNIICILIMPRFLSMFTDDERLIRYGLQYSNIIFCYAAVIALCLSFEKLFQAVGRMTVSMLCMLMGCIANIILDPLMIFGIGPFPRMGIQGAALATGTGQVLTLIAYLLVYRFSPINVKLSLRYIKPEGRICRDMYSVGIAATLNLALPSLLISALNGILAPFSQLYVLVLGVYYKLQSLLYQTANGLVQGMRPLIAYNYGAKEYKRVRTIYRTALICIVLIMAVGTVLCLLLPQQLMGLFTENADTRRAGGDALRIICFGFVPSVISVVSAGALEGLGKGMPSFLISLLRYTAVIIPAAFILSRFLGAVGVWHAFWISEILTAAAAWFIYRSSTAETRGKEETFTTGHAQ